MTYLFNRNFSVDAAGDLVLTTSPPLSDNSTDVATTAYVQAVVAAQGYNPASVTITGGTINGTSIGATTASTGNFTTGNFSSSISASNATINGTLTLTGAIVEATRVVTAAGNPTVSTADTVIVMRKTTPAVTTIALPASPTTGRYLVIKDGSGNAASFNITVSGNIDGSSSSVISTNYGSLAVVYNGSTWSVIT